MVTPAVGRCKIAGRPYHQTKKKKKDQSFRKPKMCKQPPKANGGMVRSATALEVCRGHNWKRRFPKEIQKGKQNLLERGDRGNGGGKNGKVRQEEEGPGAGVRCGRKGKRTVRVFWGPAAKKGGTME